MTWFRVDDAFHSHPKLACVSFAARGLWVTAGSWCGQHLTDGQVPAKMLKAWSAPVKLAAELVGAGLWEQTQDGYAFHEWAHHQPSREHVQSERSAARERMRALRANGKRSSEDVRPNKSEVRDSFATPVPSRPDPDQKKEEFTPHTREGSLVGRLVSKWDPCGQVSPLDVQRIAGIERKLVRLAAKRGADPVELFGAAVERLRAHEPTASKRMCTVSILCSQLEQWVDDAPAFDAKRGPAPVSTQAEWDAAEVPGE